MGELLASTGKPDEAKKAFTRALEIGRKLADQNPTVTKFWLSLSESHQRMGNLLFDTGNPAEAMKATQAAIAIRQKLADA